MTDDRVAKLEEAVKLEAGRILDATVGEKIMGMWLDESTWWQPHSYTEGARMYASIGLGSRSYHADFLPRFSTDLDAAWRVVEKLEHRFSWGIWDVCGVSSELHGPFVAFRSSTRPPVIPVDEVDPKTFYARAETVPLAICRAALAAIAAELGKETGEQ